MAPPFKSRTTSKNSPHRLSLHLSEKSPAEGRQSPLSECFAAPVRHRLSPRCTLSRKGGTIQLGTSSVGAHLTPARGTAGRAPHRLASLEPTLPWSRLCCGHGGRTGMPSTARKWALRRSVLSRSDPSSPFPSSEAAGDRGTLITQQTFLATAQQSFDLRFLKLRRMAGFSLRRGKVAIADS